MSNSSTFTKFIESEVKTNKSMFKAEAMMYAIKDFITRGILTSVKKFVDVTSNRYIAIVKVNGETNSRVLLFDENEMLSSDFANADASSVNDFIHATGCNTLVA